MTLSVSELIPMLAGLRVAVLGDAMLDRYLIGVTGRLCQEAPVPVVDVGGRRDLPGGAANSAANIRAMGAEPILLSVVGGDAEGELLRHSLAAGGISTETLVIQSTRSTLTKSRVLAGSQMVVRFDQGSTEPIDPVAEKTLLDRIELFVPECDVVLISDYGYGVLTPRVIQCLARLQARQPRIVVVDSKQLASFRSLEVTAVKPNYRETMELLGRPGSPVSARGEELESLGERILELTGSRIAAVTLDSDGSVVFERGAPPYRTYTKPAPPFHAAGAGDTYLAAMALALAAGATTPAAAELASAAASIVVAKEYTATCSAAELALRLAGDDRLPCDLPHLLPLLASHRSLNRRIVLTNGCFDILHRGHINYLLDARALGDVLIVGVNSDESIHRIKGPDRPINTLFDRLGVLRAVRCIDHLVVFDEDTPHRLIEAIRPDVFVKGGDYTRESLPEASLVEQLGGTVRILPLVAERSTTEIIRRICEVYGSRGRQQPSCFRGRRTHGNGQLDRCQERVVR